MARNYRNEYDSYHKKSKQKKRRAGRNKARAMMIKAGRAKKPSADRRNAALCPVNQQTKQVWKFYFWNSGLRKSGLHDF